MPNPERPAISGSDVTKTVALTERDVKDAARLLALLTDPVRLGHAPAGFAAPGESPGRANDRQSLIAKARIVIASRRARAQYFHRELFGEPAWDVLLALYATEDSESRFTTSKLAEFIGAPLSTVIRWVKTLEQQSLVERIDHSTDRRITFINLLDKGRQALDAYLAAMPG